jgi:hypothetical protein
MQHRVVEASGISATAWPKDFLAHITTVFLRLDPFFRHGHVGSLHFKFLFTERGLQICGAVGTMVQACHRPKEEIERVTIDFLLGGIMQIWELHS